MADITLECVAGSPPSSLVPNFSGSLNEPITNSGLREQVPWASRIGFQFFAQVGHMYPDIVCVFGMPGPPHGLQELPVREYAIRVMGQMQQQTVLDGGQMQENPCARDSSLAQVNGYIAKFDGRCALQNRRLGTTQLSANPCQ